MKIRVFSLLLAAAAAVPALPGCRAAGSAGRAEEPIAAAASHGNPALTLEEAQIIALKHAGFAADQVTALRTEYEIEYGVPQYDVEFRHGFWEYDYEIHGDTGEILSYSKDD